MTEGSGEVRELPKSWCWVKLGDVCQNIKTKKPELEPEWEFQYIDIASIDNGIKKIVSPKKYFGKDAPSRARQVVKTNDVVFSTVRTYLMNIAMVPEPLDEQIASTGFCVIRAANQIIPKYIFYFSISHNFINQLNELQRGTSYPAVRDRDIFAQLFPLCPTKEQDRIVEKIEELFSDIDQGVESLKTAQKQLKIYRQAVLKWAFEGKLTEEWRKQHSSSLKTGEALLAQIKAERENRYQQLLAEWEEKVREWEAIGKVGKKPTKPQKLKELKPLTEIELVELPEIPGGWCWIKLNEIAEKITDGEHATPKRTQEGYYLLSARNIQNGFLSLENVDYIPKDEYLRIIQRCHPEEGDILISCSGSIGRVCRVPKNLQFTMVRSVALVKIHSNIELSKYLEYQLQAPFLQKVINSKKKATAQANLFIGPISELPIALSSLEEQEQIVQEIESRLSICDQLEDTIIENLQKAEGLRQSILKQAFEGKLVPQDPNDEPAEKLLERIKAERQVNGNTSKKSKPSHQQLTLQEL